LHIDLRQSLYGSPNHQEFGLRIGSPMFKASSPFTHLITVHTTNLFNVLHALRNAPEWTDVLAYDEFEVRVVTRRPPPWGGTKVAKWADDHDTRACAWFQDVGIPANVGVVGRSIQMIARENPVHPVREYLNALHWDRTPRLDFAMCLRASPVLPDRIGPGVSKPLIFPVPSGRAVRGGALGRATHWNARLQLLLKLTPAK
jgi:hypothetical protein